jgi:hypothetical protein
MQFCFFPSHQQILVISAKAVGRALLMYHYKKAMKYAPPPHKKYKDTMSLPPCTLKVILSQKLHKQKSILQMLHKVS